MIKFLLTAFGDVCFLIAFIEGIMIFMDYSNYLLQKAPKTAVHTKVKWSGCSTLLAVSIVYFLYRIGCYGI